MTSLFYLGRGPSGAMRFYQPAAGAEPWVDDPDRAFRFESREDAHHVAEALMLAMGKAVATVADSGAAEAVQGQGQVQHHAGSMWVGPV